MAMLNNHDNLYYLFTNLAMPMPDWGATMTSETNSYSVRCDLFSVMFVCLDSQQSP